MRKISILLAALAGLGTAALTGLAAGKSSHSLVVEKNVKDARKGNALENVVANPHGLALYYLSGETKSHPLCTKSGGCFGIWKPFHPSSASKAPGIKGKLGRWHRNGFTQVTLSRHPLYTFHTDSKGVAMGDLIHSFGGTWHLIVLSSGGSPGTTTTTTTPTTPTTTPTTPCYPPYC